MHGIDEVKTLIILKQCIISIFNFNLGRPTPYSKEIKCKELYD